MFDVRVVPVVGGMFNPEKLFKKLCSAVPRVYDVKRFRQKGVKNGVYEKKLIDSAFVCVFLIGL